MVCGFIQDGGNAAQCLGHRFKGRIQAAAISTTTGLVILDLAIVSTGTLGYTNFLHIVGNLVNFFVRCEK